MVELATKIMVGAKLKKLGFGTGLYPNSPYVAVKVPVFSFEKLNDVNSQLGPEMKSTGEVLGIGKTVEEALKLTNAQVVEELGGLPAQKLHCSVLAEEAIKAAVHDYLTNYKAQNK